MRTKIKGLVAVVGAMLFVGVTAAVASCTPNATTGVTVDVFRSDDQPPIKGTNWQAQTFTTLGLGCFLLNQVTISVRKENSPGALVVEIYNVASPDTPAFPVGLGGSATPLASATVLPSSVPTTYTDIVVPFTSPPQLTGGVQYALVVHQVGGTGQNFYQLGVDDDNPYPGGRYCKSTSTGWDCPAGPGGGIDVRISTCVSPCSSSFCTFTQGAYGATCQGNNPACLLDTSFSGLFPSGLVVGNASCGFTLAYTSSSAVHTALPAGGPPAALTSNLVDPPSLNNVFAGQVTTLRINVAFSDGGITPAGLKDFVLPAQFCTQDLNNLADIKTWTVPASLVGMTVGQVLTSAQNKLAGGTCTVAISIGDLNQGASLINEAFDECRQVVACP